MFQIELSPSASKRLFFFAFCIIGFCLPFSNAYSQAGIITTAAGNGYWGNSGDGGPATSAQVSDPPSVALDSQGNIYIADGYYGVIRKVTKSTGIITTIVGTGTAGFSGDGGLATAAQIDSVQGMALDSAGNLYLSGGGRIRKVTGSTGIITTIAGNGNWGYSGDGGPATSASLENNGAVAVDSAGNVFFTDEYNAVIREISAATGIITTVAGNGTAGYSGDGGQATLAELNMPYGLAVDPAGNLYIADSGANVIRKVTRSTGVITTVAGNGTAGYSGDGGSAISAELNIPAGDVAVDPLGNLFITDSGNNVIRMVTASTGVISTIAGNTTAGYAGDGGSAVNAELNSPQGLALDSAGNIYIADHQNDRIRAVSSVVQEPVTTMPTITWTPPTPINYGTPLSATQLSATASVQGTFSYQPAAGAILPSGLQALNLVFTPANQSSYSIALATVPLTVNAATPTITWPTPASIPYGVPLGAGQLNATSDVAGTFSYDPPAGTVLSPGTYTLNTTFTPDNTAAYNSATASVSLVVSILPSGGIIATLAGNGYWNYTGDGGPAIDATMSRPRGVAIDAAGNVYFVDESNAVVRKVTASTRIISTIAGTGTSGYSGDGGAATSAQLGDPYGIALDAAGNIYITDALYAVIRKISAATGIITTVAGNGVRDDSGDGGPAISAELCDVLGVAVDSAGNIYIADTGNNRIRKVDASTGIINTIAGNHIAGYSGDGGPATSAILNGPNGVVLDSAGNLYFSDNANNVVRKISTSGIITTVVGTGAEGYTGDGGPATAATLNSPREIALDSAGNLYVADELNCVIREVSASSGTISTIAGSVCSGFSGDGGSATSAQLYNPAGVAVDAAGNVYIGDSANLRVRVVGSGSGSSSNAGVTVAPMVATLHPGQQQTFSAAVTGLSNTSVTWSANLGAITQTGQYTAPATIATQQSAIVTATSQVDTTKSASATVTLLPAIAVSITPDAGTLATNQTLQFTATVSNTSDTSVVWSISPAGMGSVSAAGLYTAPASVSAQQTVTITATSRADSSKSASATVIVEAAQCSSNGYGHERSIVVDHTRVPNTDQLDFPMLVSGSYPFLATVANSGMVQNSNGYDIIFTSDPTGQNLLDFEIDNYNPVTGLAAFWVRIPTLSHTVDTTIYMWYGNASIQSSQENKAGVWKNNYLSVYHLGNGSTLGLADSGKAGYDLVPAGSGVAGPGIIGGAAVIHGDYASSLYHNFVTAYPTGASPVTLEAWVQRTVHYTGGGDFVGYGDNLSVGARIALGEVSPTDAVIDFENLGISGPIQSDINWHHLVGVYGGGALSAAIDELYVDGAPVANSVGTGTPSFTSTQFKIGGIPTVGNCCGLSGSVDEVRVSSVARSGDWVASEYNNESSPSTFYAVSPENEIVISPGGATLAASESQSFTAVPLGDCSANVYWSINPSGSPSTSGTISPSGQYTAPSTISTSQTVTVIATSQANSTKTGTAIVNLAPNGGFIPPNPSLVLAALTQSPYQTGTPQGFVVNVTSSAGVSLPGVNVSFNVVGSNTATGTIETDPSGIASYSYVGANSGNDTITASATVNGQLVTSNVIQASWIAVAPLNGEGRVTLFGQPPMCLEALLGAFTDSSGTVIEPIAIGASRRVFVVPTGATQLQLGVEDGYFSDNHGQGFVVSVNDISVSVAAGAMPWLWVSGGQNANYSYGVQDGTNPTVVPGLSPGETVVVAYQSGLNSPGGSYPVAYDANGVPGTCPGEAPMPGNGTVGPNYYMTAASYPVNQPVSIMATIENGSGSPFANVPVFLKVSGANPGLLEATSDASGVAVFQYTGTTAGKDTVIAEVIPQGESVIDSAPMTVTWTPTFGLPSGSVVLSPATVNPLPAGSSQSFTAYATDSFGQPIANLVVGLDITGADQKLLSGPTDSTGHVTIIYQNTNPGTALVKAVAFINNLVAVSNVVSVPWTLPPSTTGGTGGSGSLSISIAAHNTVSLPNTLQVGGTVTDTNLPQGGAITTTWSQVSGSGTVTFANPQQVATTASFSAPGTYVLELTATDPNGSGSAQITITVNPEPQTTQGWIGSPANGGTISGIVPITVVSSENLQSGTLTFYPVGNANSVTVLDANTTGSGQIGTLDTTILANGQYWITLQATDTNGNSSYNLALVTVVGNYKPGRVTSNVTDLVVPAKGLAIQIQRTYDSLNAGTSGDFGYGWNLSTSVDLVVNPLGSVTFTLGGQRRTFYLTPQPNGFLPFYVPIWTPEPGMHGTLVDAGSGCSDFFDYLVPEGPSWACVGGGFFTPPGYVYTDPSGTAYTMTATGQLQSIVDKNGNALTITPNGITSSTGLSVPFLRDSKGRITKITDPQGNEYHYGYLDADGNDHGNLQTVTYPNTAQPSTYTYDASHLYLSGTDFRNNPLPSTSYYGSTDTDTHGNSLNGRLQSVTDALGEKTTYDYDLTTNTTTITYPPDGAGNVGTATMVYDTMGDLLSSTDPLGHKTTNTYDTNQNLLSTTDPLNHTTCYTYDGNGNRTSVSYPGVGNCTTIASITTYNQFSEPTQTIDELGNVRNFNYDVNFNPQSVTDSIGPLASFVFNNDGTMQSGAIGFDIAANPSKASQFAYDANGNLICRTDALGRATSYSYDSLGHKTTMTEPQQGVGCVAPGTTNAGTTTYKYDAFGNLTETDAPLGRITSSQYDANGNKQYDIDGNQHKTSYTYDALNRLIRTDYPDSTYTRKTYDFRGNVVDEWDQAQNQTHHEYDLAGREVKVTRAYGTSAAAPTSYAYYDDGRKYTEEDPLGHTTTYTYNIAGDLTGVSGPAGNFTYGYDNARNRVSMTQPVPAGSNISPDTTTYQYDARKRLIETDYPDGTKKTNTYDGAGNLASVTDQNGNEVQYTYDAANQLQSVIQTSSPNAPNNVTSYSYDPLGNLMGLNDANSHLTESNFDLLSQPVSKTLPDGSLTESRHYDVAGNLTSLTHFNQKTTTYTYDSLNRLLSRTPDPTTGEHAVTFSYTATGKRQTMTDASGTTNFNYDAMDRLTTKATPEGTLNYTYDAAGHLASMTSSHSNGLSVSYTYDSLNRLSTVIDGRLSGNQTTTYGYDSASNVASVTYPNTVQYGFAYDSLNRLTQIATGSTGYMYSYDNAGNRKTANELNGRSVSWNFDGINRLTSESITGASGNANGSVSYGLDPVGNRTSVTSSLSGVNSGSFTFNADDELAGESYDPNGNVTATGGKTFTYDSENHLVSMNGGAVQIVYDGDGNRVAKTVYGVTSQYLFDDLNPTGYPQVVEELSSGTVTRTYTYGLQRISQNQVISNTWMPSFYGYDGFGTVRQLTNSAGAITDTYDYDAFGNEVHSTGTTPNSYLYRGEQYDPDLGLYYLRARYYNPTTGRFMSRDPENGKPLNPASLHKYLYVGGNPVNGWDPTGKSTVAEDLQLGARALGTAAGLIAEAAAITCTLDLAASELAAVVNQYKIVGIDWPSCTAKTDNECAELRQEIYEFMNLINEKIDDLLIDNCDLYSQAYDIVNPSLPGACGKTTWVGHQQQVRDLQQGLRNRLKEAERKGCPIPPGAWALATRPVPNQPRGN